MIYNAYCVLFAVLPWSIDLDLGVGQLLFPAEPLMAVLGPALLFSLRVDHIRQAWDRTKWLPCLAFAYMAWMMLSVVWSTMPQVSAKYCLVEATHALVFGVGFWLYPALWRPCLRWMGISVTFLTVYVLGHHSIYSFRPDQALLAPMPFFPEHNMWACLLVMLLFLWFYAWQSVEPKWKILYKWLPLIWILAIALTASRGAWLSAWLALGILGLTGVTRGKKMLFGVVWFSGMAVGIWLFSTRSGYVSELERLNRWHCAWQMTAERPVTGFGPGTFQFQYLPFQQPEDMTRISLKTPLTERNPDNYGKGGGAHAEWARVLAENGWP
ncbi:MAG: O-antigen ligase family protein, partial [Saprospiraceae bacterium]|nr:O-antigen ligase family protein [Saprospiraceae bacterium]